MTRLAHCMTVDGALPSEMLAERASSGLVRARTIPVFLGLGHQGEHDNDQQDEEPNDPRHESIHIQTPR
jgi:hypothetical protein